MPFRTGYDAKLVERCNDTFAAVAEKEGTVTEVNDYAITVTYKDGSTRQVEVGRKYGKSGGFMTSHDVITKLKVGDKLQKGDIIAYNKDFFTEDPMNPGKIAMKTATLARVALIEHPYTFEDSCAVTKRIAENTKVKTTVQKMVTVNFNQSIHKLAKPGTKVNIDDPLCFIEDSLTHDAGLFDENSINLLRNISQQAPRSAVNGIIDKVEILYNGDKEDMSESLLKLVNISDSKLIALNKSLGKKPMTGEVDETYRVDGNPLQLDTAVIIFTISGEQNIGVGDKLVLANQLKNTIGFVYEQSPRIMSEDGGFGEEIDMLFGSNSVYNRIVNSPFLIGMMNTLLIEVSKKLATEYLEGV